MFSVSKETIPHLRSIVFTISFSLCTTAFSQNQETQVLDLSVSTDQTLPSAKKHVFSLEQAIEYALTHNPDLQIAQQRIAQAEAQLGEALSSFYPQVTARYSYQYTENPAMAFTHTINQRRLDFNSDFNNPGGVQNFRPEVVANYSLFRGGQDYQLSEAAKLGIEAAALEKSAIRNRLTQTVASTYYGYLAAQEAHKVTINSIKAVTSELKQSRIRFQAGALLKSDILSLEVRFAEAKDAKIQAENNIELVKTGLKTLLGLTIDQPFDIVEKSDWQLPRNMPDFTEILEIALKQRPEIEAANKQIAMQQRVLSAAKGAHLPRADAYVSYGQDSRDGSFSSNRDHVTAGVTVEMNIFSGFATTERVKKARSKLTEIQEIKRRIQLNIENEIKTAYLRLQEALARIDITTAAIASAEEARRMVKEQRQAGAITVTRYIESEVARDKTHSLAIAAQFDALQAKAELDKAQGLWR
jgi:outer membrane protein TolC